MFNRILKEIESASKLWQKVKNRSNQYNGRDIESIATRFVKLLECYGVHRNQIPRFIGHGLTLADVQDDENLLNKLTEKLLDGMCEKLAIRREWLDGAESKIYLEHDFYKYPEEFMDFVNNLQVNNQVGQITGVLIAPEERDLDSHALIILQEVIDYIGDKPIYRFHLCNNWAFTYWKARAFLTACIAIAWKCKIYIHGITKPQDFINNLANGETLLGWEGDGVYGIGRRTWNPEDMCLRTEAYLNDIDPEQKKYGLKSALELWIDLEKRGYMDAGFGSGIRKAFETELVKYEY